MDFLTILGGAITFGSALGATVAGFFAYRQKSLVTLLRESNEDYAKRVKQLEDERDSLNVKIDTLTLAVQELQKQKALPLENLTALIVEADNRQMNTMAELAKSIADIPSQITTTISTTTTKRSRQKR